jgi:crossover junction endodeoxyribonuclease RusA
MAPDAATVLWIEVGGKPAPQGSKNAFVAPSGRMVVKESSAGVKPWRADVRRAAREVLARATGWTGNRPHVPVRVEVTFWRVRPAGHYGTGRNAGIVKPSAPPYPTTVPDGDKMERATNDALKEAGVLHDDAQIVEMTWRKAWRDTPGASLRIEVLS